MSEQKQWMASAPGIAYMGPYASDVEAWRAVRGDDGLPVDGARVWPIADSDLLIIRRGGFRHGKEI
jgi:hypothetical protein